METILRQSVGIDIAKASFTACACHYYENGRSDLSTVAKFDNNTGGFNQLMKWARKHCQSSTKVVFAMEATGIYYESLAYHLCKLNQQIWVILPNKVKHYTKSLNIKSKTDSIDAGVIARMAVERKHDQWQPPLPVFKQLREITRQYTTLKTERTSFINKLKSQQAGFEPLEFVSQSTRAVLEVIENEIIKCEAEINNLISQDAWLERKVADLRTIKGLGLITIAIIIAETQGFQQITNAKQLTSYAGYDVVQRESGSSISGKTRISKKGNNRIRAALHFPSLVAARWNDELKTVFIRINKGKVSKMIGATALQRKILILAYSLWKNDTVYKTKEDRVG